MDSRRRDLLKLGLVATAGALAGCGKERAARAPIPAGDAASRKPAELPPPIAAGQYERRRERAAQAMKSEGYDYLLVTPSPALIYLTGAELHRSERLIALVMDAGGECQSLGPAFEAERLRASGLPGSLTTWEEDEDPIASLAGLLSGHGSSPRVAVEGSTWFDTLAPLARRMPTARIASATSLLAPLRMRKEPEEIALIQAAALRTRAIIERAAKEARQGETERELLKRTQALATAEGLSLDGLVQFGPTSAIPHAGAGDHRLLDPDVMLFDCGIRVHGYTSDVSRTFSHGNATPRFQSIYSVVRAAQEEALRAARAGITVGSVDEAARGVIRKAGFSRYFTHRLGHGLGLEGHEPPYLVPGGTQVLEEGMTVTIEPGIYLPGEFGVRIEDDVVITSAIPRILSRQGDE